MYKITTVKLWVPDAESEDSAMVNPALIECQAITVKSPNH